MFDNKTDQRGDVLSETAYQSFLAKIDAQELSDTDLQEVNGSWGGWGWGSGWGGWGGCGGWGGWGGWGGGWGGWGGFGRGRFFGHRRFRHRRW